MTDLLEGEQYIKVTGTGDEYFIVTEREWASGIIKLVADECDYGSYPHEVSAFDLGRAIGRALSNSPEKDVAVDELLRGIKHYKETRGRKKLERS